MKGEIKICMMCMVILLMACKNGNTEQANCYNCQRGQEAMSEEKYDEALTYLEKELTENPKNGYAWKLKQFIYFNMDIKGESITSGEKALKYLPRKDKEAMAMVHNKLGETYYYMNNLRMAKEELLKAIKCSPNDVNNVRLCACICNELKEYDEADKMYEKALEIEPGNGVTYTTIGRSLLERKLYDQAIEKLSYATKLCKDYPRLYSVRATCYLKKRDYNSAAKDIVKAMDIGWDDEAADLLCTQNDTLYQNLSQRIKAKIKNTNRHTWIYLLGIVQQHNCHFSEAIQQFQKMMELNGPDASLYSSIARCYREMGDYKKALHFIDESIAIDSAKAIYINEKANLYYYLGNTDKAIEQIGLYIEKEPESHWGYYRRGFYKDNIHDVEGAIDDYTTCIMWEPDFAYAYLGRGDMYKLKGDTVSANADYKKVLEKDTVVCEQGNCRQYALLELGMKDSAMVYLQKILEEYPTESNYYDAACLMSRIRDKKRSLEYLRTAFEKGYHEIKHLELDDDMDYIRDTKEFKQMVDEYRELISMRNSNDDKLAGSVKDSVQTETEISYTEEAEAEVIEVPFKKDGGMMKISCTINDLPLHFIVDTGASVVSLSDVEANFMMKNGYLSEQDIIGKSEFAMADGSISEGVILNLKHIEFGELTLSNVRASVVKNQKAPLLLGQSVFQRLGKIEIDNTNMVMKVTHKKDKI